MTNIILKWQLIICTLSALRELEQRKENIFHFADLVKLIMDYLGKIIIADLAGI